MSISEPLSNYSLADHEKNLRENPVLLYMKGTTNKPLCGFSKSAVDILRQCGASFTAINVLEPDIRTALKKISNWSTFPQLYISHEFIGGIDIIKRLYAQGELQKQLSSAYTEH